MNVYSWILFLLTWGYFLAPTVSGVRWLVQFRLMKIYYNEKHEFLYILIPTIISCLFAGALLVGLCSAWFIIWKYAIFDYIVSVGFCLMVSITTSMNVFLPIDEEVDSYTKAFRKGYTEGIAMRLIKPAKKWIHLVYILILLTSHIISLYFRDSFIYTSDFFKFIEANKYGIVIMYAFEKIITSFSKKEDEKGCKILRETSLQLDEEEKKSQEEYQENKRKTKEVIKKVFEAKKARRQSKKK